MIKLQKNQLEKNCFELAIEVFFLLKKSFRYLCRLFFHHEFSFQVLGLRRQLSAMLAIGKARASLSLHLSSRSLCCTLPC